MRDLIYVPLIDCNTVHLQALKAVGVRFVVAPYEADAQLAYLSMRGIVDIVITEDGDTIPFGCRKVGRV